MLTAACLSTAQYDYLLWQRSTTDYLLPTTDYLLLTSYYWLSTTYCLLLTIYYVLPTTTTCCGMKEHS